MMVCKDSLVKNPARWFDILSLSTAIARVANTLSTDDQTPWLTVNSQLCSLLDQDIRSVLGIT